MSITEKYTVHSIQSHECKEWVLKKHYAKKIPPIEHAFGLFDDGIMIGICTYGTPVSSVLRGLWKGFYKLMELNRLVVNEGLEKNVLSYFVSQTLKMMPSPLVIVSYADSSQNHHGYIYQATNFIYTGLSAKFKDYAIKGMDHLHGATVMDMSRGKKDRVKWLREKFGDKLYMKERARKYRYFYFIGDKRDKRRMMSLLPYAIEAYPKGENIRYDAQYEPTIQTKLF